MIIFSENSVNDIYHVKLQITQSGVNFPSN